MSVMTSLRNAGSGWSEILAGRPTWEEKFALTPEGLNRAFLVYGCAVLIAFAVWTARFGFLLPQHLLPLMIVYLAPLAILIVLATLLGRMVQPAVNVVRLIVPGLYIIALMMVIEGLTLLIGIPLLGAITALTGFFMFKLARVNGVELWRSVGFGVVFFVLLVLARLAL